MCFLNPFYLPRTILQELAWHTYQLDHTCYRSDTLQFLDMVPNHDDAVKPLPFPIATMPPQRRGRRVQ